MNNKFHHFHMVTLSPWPLMASIQAMSSTAMMSYSMSMKFSMIKSILTATATIMCSMAWWKNTLSESLKEGMHQNSVMNGLKMGMVMFIMSEVMFFSSFFWSYFHSGISPSLEIGQNWPPKSINSFDPTNVPLLNTLILISSGVSITWSHHELLKNNQKTAKLGMLITCSLGLYFTALQYMEYAEAEFGMTDASYGSIFFMGTGFHGIHVIIGTTFLLVVMKLMSALKMSSNHHMSFEMAAWYWHFVDIVWLFLYLSIYWWGK